MTVSLLEAANLCVIHKYVRTKDQNYEPDCNINERENKVTLKRSPKTVSHTTKSRTAPSLSRAMGKRERLRRFGAWLRGNSSSSGGEENAPDRESRRLGVSSTASTRTEIPLPFKSRSCSNEAKEREEQLIIPPKTITPAKPMP